MQQKKVNANRNRVKRVILLAFVFMMVGIVSELYLLEHYEDTLQLIPILCIGVALITMIILHVKRTNFVSKFFQFILIAIAMSGIYGVFLHLNANYEFEQEMKPTASGWDLFTESLSGALPTLAPLSMIILALLGYSYLILINQKQ